MDFGEHHCSLELGFQREYAGIPNPSAGITQVRFQGYALRPSGHPFGIFLFNGARPWIVPDDNELKK